MLEMHEHCPALLDVTEENLKKSQAIRQNKPRQTILLEPNTG